ncbi:hypothetical protein AOL_s00079g192 [Orbilia oligospora ATCC 24927]|uniref:Uncharacterized protein n=2 Tax=Orbilia oligospora TaxID=2813651 RepID=G1XD89_ARTOA|nr:hypothetical protein AOL_s00079g192 [Orbilia oligospora ATCC 24927]EGX48971.1 hypothetical protein AOL_s00079g192 [Orbilia oligospora ATCC 24927]KAF3284782.1 hypothetical protein TWF970_011064 [Orbilia oligospora]
MTKILSSKAQDFLCDWNSSNEFIYDANSNGRYTRKEIGLYVIALQHIDSAPKLPRGFELRNYLFQMNLEKATPGTNPTKSYKSEDIKHLESAIMFYVGFKNWMRIQVDNFRVPDEIKPGQAEDTSIEAMMRAVSGSKQTKPKQNQGDTLELGLEEDTNNDDDEEEERENTKFNPHPRLSSRQAVQLCINLSSEEDRMHGFGPQSGPELSSEASFQPERTIPFQSKETEQLPPGTSSTLKDFPTISRPIPIHPSREETTSVPHSIITKSSDD